MFLLGDLGGTRIRLGFSPDGRIIENPVICDSPDDFDEAVQLIKEQARIISKARPIRAACFGVAATFNKSLSTIIHSAHNPLWNNKDIKIELEKAINCPTLFENDTSIVGLGEAITGPGIGKEIVVYITVSTGVGGTRIINGKIDKKANSFEIGHQIIDLNGLPCPSCQTAGHLEAYIAGSGLLKKYGMKAEQITDPKVWGEVAKYLAIGIHNTVLHWSPDIVVLGGSVMKQISLDNVKAELYKRLTIVPVPEIGLAKSDDMGGLYGALEYLKQQPYALSNMPATGSGS